MSSTCKFNYRACPYDNCNKTFLKRHTFITHVVSCHMEEDQQVELCRFTLDIIAGDNPYDLCEHTEPVPPPPPAKAVTKTKNPVGRPRKNPAPVATIDDLTDFGEPVVKPKAPKEAMEMFDLFMSMYDQKKKEKESMYVQSVDEGVAMA